MNVLVTCGPALAPIDEVRRITNFSTGALGIRLANGFAASGHRVVCLKGSAATCPTPIEPGIVCRTFRTNQDVAALCREQREAGGADLVLHAAALSDFEVAEVRDEAGNVLDDAKIPSRAGRLHVILKPAEKVITSLRDWFPTARIVGWKYELHGSRNDAIAAGERQILEARSDACVVNGRAYGEGFGILEANGRLTHCIGGAELCRDLLVWSNG